MYNQLQNPDIRNAFLRISNRVSLNAKVFTGVLLIFLLVFGLISYRFNSKIQELEAEVLVLSEESATGSEYAKRLNERTNQQDTALQIAERERNQLETRVGRAFASLGVDMYATPEPLHFGPKDQGIEVEDAVETLEESIEVPEEEVIEENPAADEGCWAGDVERDPNLDRSCAFEYRNVNVRFVQAAPEGLDLTWNDEETARLYQPQWLWGSALTNTTHVNRSGHMEILIHVDNKIGDHGLPYGIDFGPESFTFLVDVSGSEQIMGQKLDEWTGQRYVSVLQYGDIVQVLIEEEPLSGPPYVEKHIESVYFTVMPDHEENPEIIWLLPGENNGFTRAGVSLYLGPISCGEGGTCLSINTHENHDGAKDEVFVWSEGSSGTGMIVPAENVAIRIPGASYILNIPDYSKVR